MAEIEGGDKLRRALADIARKVRSGGTLRVGFLAGSTYPNGTPTALIASLQNFGAPRAGIPPRPFLSNAIAAHSGEWPDVIRAQLKATDYDVPTTMNRMGALIKSQIQESLAQTFEPPLSPVTLMIRQIIGPLGTPTFADVLEARRRVAAGEVATGVSTKPLIWTSHLLNSVAFEFEDA